MKMEADSKIGDSPQDAFKDLKEAADKLADYAKELFSSKPSLLQRGC